MVNVTAIEALELADDMILVDSQLVTMIKGCS